MYRDPYNNRIDQRIVNLIKETNKEIDEMKKDVKADKMRLMRLQEQRLMQGGMLTQLDGAYGKYRNPW